VTPKISAIRQDDTHRLIPSAFSSESALRRLAEGSDQLDELIELEGATNERLLGEANLLPGISIHELLFAVPYAEIVNATFTHARPDGSRFNRSDRGAWYAAFELKTAQAEVSFHKLEELREAGWREAETFTFDDYLADFRSEFHDLRGNTSYKRALNPDSYADSQKLAAGLLASASAGIVYPSVRRSGGTCLVCFRPALVMNVRRGRRITLTLRVR
jgi:hypothetical protein